MHIIEIVGMNVAQLDDEGAIVGSEADALDLMGEAYGHDFDIVAIPMARLPADFFKLSTGLAGAVVQKLTNYHMRAAFVGEIPANLQSSKPLQDFIRETNKRRQIMIVPTIEALKLLLER